MPEFKTPEEALDYAAARGYQTVRLFAGPTGEVRGTAMRYEDDQPEEDHHE
jgi:hypothetical protein